MKKANTNISQITAGKAALQVNNPNTDAIVPINSPVLIAFIIYFLYNISGYLFECRNGWQP